MQVNPWLQFWHSPIVDVSQSRLSSHTPHLGQMYLVRPSWMNSTFTGGRVGGSSRGAIMGLSFLGVYAGVLLRPWGLCPQFPCKLLKKFVKTLTFATWAGVASFVRQPFGLVSWGYSACQGVKCTLRAP